MNIAPFIEHTNLSPLATLGEIETLAHDAITNSFHGICVAPFWVKKVRRDLTGSEIKLITVIGFPLGYTTTETKYFETNQALEDGVDEIDLVWNIAAFKSGMTWCKTEMAKIANRVHAGEKILKVIIETAYLSEEEIILASKMCVDAGTDFVKTSTGFAPEGARVRHVELIRSAIPSSVGIKASGGIRTKEDALALINAGATRIGTSSSLKLIS